MRDKINQFWSTLQQREKATVLTGCILVVVTAMYLVFANAWTARLSLLQEKAELLAEQAWMQEQSMLAEQLLNSCRENQILALAETDLLNLLATRNQLELATIRASGSSYLLEVETSDGNNILRFIHQSACQGFTLSSVQIEKGESAENYTGQVEFSHEG